MPAIRRKRSRPRSVKRKSWGNMETSFCWGDSSKSSAARTYSRFLQVLGLSVLVDELPAGLIASGLPVPGPVKLVQPELRFEGRTVHPEYEVVEPVCPVALN